MSNKVVGLSLRVWSSVNGFLPLTVFGEHLQVLDLLYDDVIYPNEEDFSYSQILQPLKNLRWLTIMHSSEREGVSAVDRCSNIEFRSTSE